MIAKRPLIFWLLVWGTLTILFSTSLDSVLLSFFFVTFLIPVVMATSLFFNQYLVPHYLMAGRKLRFILYCIYMIIVSIYLELLVMVLAFVILADYQIDNLGKIAGDIYLLTVILYFIVFFDGLILAIQKMNEKDRIITEMEDELNKNNQSEISIKVKRKNIPLKLEDILYVESLGDYVKVHTSDQVHITKEKISALDERLPNSFVRIHRSFLINRDHIQSYNKEFVTVNNIELTIGRKYKNVVEERL